MLKMQTARVLKAKNAKNARVRQAGTDEAQKAKAVRAPRAPDQYFSRAVGKALEILELLQGELNPVPMNEIARQIQLSKTSAFRILRTLVALGCVASDGRGQYKLAPGIHAVTPTQWLGKLLRVGTPYLQALSRELMETVSLAALFENRVEVIAVVESPHAVRMSNIVGHILPPNASSLGKAIAAFQPPERQQKLLRSFGTYRFTDRTIIDPKELDREFERVRINKFAVDREECNNGGICFCVPIFGPNGQVSAAISVSLPKTRLGDAEHEEVIVATARVTSEQLALDLQKA
jgi:DNA-binding IclR family transcriptional regulator